MEFKRDIDQLFVEMTAMNESKKYFECARSAKIQSDDRFYNYIDKKQSPKAKTSNPK